MDTLFRDCTKLKTVRLPSEMKVIAQWMFEGCKALEQIKLPAGLTHIDNGAFRGSGLTSIVIPASVVRVGAFAFEYCTDLQSVTFEDDNVKNWQTRPTVCYHANTLSDINKEYIFRVVGYPEYEEALDSIVLKDTVQEYIDNRIGIIFNIRDIATNEVTDYRVMAGDKYGIYTVVDGNEIPLTLSCSLCKGDTFDANGCGWTTDNFFPVH